MIPKSRTLEKLLEKKFFPMRSKLLTYINNPTIPAMIEVKANNKVALLNWMRCLNPTMKNAAIVPMSEVTIQGNITSAGFEAFAAAR